VTKEPSGQLSHFNWLGWIAVAAGLVSIWVASLVRVEETAAPVFNSSKLPAAANTISLNSQLSTES